VLVQHGAGWQLLPMVQAASESAAFCLDTRSRWSVSHVEATPRLPISLPAGLDLRTLLACLAATQLAGALMETFQRTLQYANERSQFGRPIGRFQAIQHQLAVMSEHVFAAHMAAQLGCTGEGMHPDRLRVAVAKARCSQAALAVAEASHAIHGAIGFTAEYDLQLLTRRLHAWRQAAGSESYWHAVAGAALVDAHRGTTLDMLRATTDITV
jgi:acyl-CoA dehydrogenase